MHLVPCARTYVKYLRNGSLLRFISAIYFLSEQCYVEQQLFFYSNRRYVKNKRIPPFLRCQMQPVRRPLAANLKLFSF